MAKSADTQMNPTGRVLAVIPARGGSKGIPNKNIAPVAGRPLIAWTIAAAQEARCVERVVLTTDSPVIAEVAREYGAETPFLRPPELAEDDTPGIVPILHAVGWLDEHEGYCPDYVMALQPTSPLRTAQDIEAAARLAWEKAADGVVSVCPAKHHPYWMKKIAEDGRMADFLPIDREYTRRQDLPPVYALNGALYLVRREVLVQRETWYTDRTYAYVMPPERSLDVDTPWELYLADLILRERREHDSH